MEGEAPQSPPALGPTYLSWHLLQLTLAGAKMHLLGGWTGQLLEAEAMPGSTQLSLATVLAEQCHPPLLLKSTPCAKWASGCPSPL